MDAGPKDTTDYTYNRIFMKDFNELPDQEKDRIRKYCKFMYRVEKRFERRKWDEEE